MVYQDEEYKDAFDAVATVFFIDTAPNLINYIETVKHCLKPGGIWANLGPLLWHSGSKKSDASGEDDEEQQHESAEGAHISGLGIGEPGSIELSEDEVIALLEKFDFKIEKHEADQYDIVPTGYVSNPRSMLRSVYYPCHWVAIKS